MGNTSTDHDLALWAIDQKLEAIGNVSDSRQQNSLVLASIAEACWWLASLDEHLEERYRDSYTSVRDTDASGITLAGIRWARHRHTHDLIATTSGDVRPFFSDESDAVFFISSPYRWRSVESMNLQGKSATRNADQRQCYVEELEGKPVHSSLAAATRWLADAVGTLTHQE